MACLLHAVPDHEATAGHRRERRGDPVSDIGQGQDRRLRGSPGGSEQGRGDPSRSGADQAMPQGMGGPIGSRPEALGRGKVQEHGEGGERVKSSTGGYSTSIRKRKDGGYNVEIFSIFADGLRIGLNAHDGATSLDEARKIAREWMFEYEVQNEFQDIPDNGGPALRINLSVALGPMLGKLAHDRGMTKDQFLDYAVVQVRAAA